MPDAPVADPAARGWFARHYGAGPWHLVSLLVCFLVAGYAVLRWLDSPSEVRLLVWFAGAVIGHDFVLFPIYSAVDRLIPRRRAQRPARVAVLNHVRVPLMFSGLLLLLFFPLIFNKPEPAYQAATGLDTSPYLDRWLLVSAGFFGVSALIYVVRLLRSPRSGAVENSAMPASNGTSADHPSS